MLGTRDGEMRIAERRAARRGKRRSPKSTRSTPRPKSTLGEARARMSSSRPTSPQAASPSVMGCRGGGRVTMRLRVRTFSMAAANALTTFFSFFLSNKDCTRATNSAFLPLRHVRTTRSPKRPSSGRSASAGCVGRNPPKRSDESVCWLRLSTTTFAPACDENGG